MLVEFSLKLLNCTMCEKTFQNYGVLITIKCIDSRHYYSCPYPPLQVLVITSYANYSFPQAAFFRKSVFHNSRKKWRKLWFDLSKFSQKMWRWLGTLGFYILYDFEFFQMWWLYNFVNNIYHIACYKFYCFSFTTMIIWY